MKHRSERATPSIDHLVQMLGMRLRNQQNVEDVFEGEWKGERQGELENTHDGSARPQQQMRPHVAEEAHERRRRKNAVEEALEKASTTLIGLCGSFLLHLIGRIRRHRGAGNHSGMTIGHLNRITAQQRTENTRASEPARSGSDWLRSDVLTGHPRCFRRSDYDRKDVPVEGPRVRISLCAPS